MTTQSASFAADAADIFARALDRPHGRAGDCAGTVGNDHIGENALLRGGGQSLSGNWAHCY
jgi:hypothetical protein